MTTLTMSIMNSISNYNEMHDVFLLWLHEAIWDSFFLPTEIASDFGMDK